ncbi:MAG: dTDP-4-dehydrorhamnose reductase [Candidatus Gastranaerophilales bacterium]|nr:dTDP-4-dehydrorhamnose reductase [Candidatus Gastranaerophilales bacterium]
MSEAKLPQKILVTGANGMLGKDLCPALEAEGFEVIKTDIDNLDITDLTQVEEFFANNTPDFIVHCAAYTNVDGAEENPELAEKINVLGSKNIALQAKKYDIPILAVSTDYVFDGRGLRPYEPTDKPDPQSVYGATKLGGELAVKEQTKKYFIARTSWLYGIHGKNFVETMIALAQKMPELKVVDDQIGCPTWTMELANGIIKIIREQKPYGIYHICGSGFTSWYGFAKKIFELARMYVNLKPCTTEEFPRPAKRPAYSVMDNNNICRHWEEALEDYMKLR